MTPFPPAWSWPFSRRVFTVREAGSLSHRHPAGLCHRLRRRPGLRVREPDLPRRFTTPWVWFVAPMGAVFALLLMSALPSTTWIRLIVWFVIGLVVYFAYGVRRSRFAHPHPPRRPSIPAGSRYPS